MDKQAEQRIENRLRRLFANGMPDDAFDVHGLQTRGSFLKNRPGSPFGLAVRKRPRVETGSAGLDEEGEGGEDAMDGTNTGGIATETEESQREDDVQRGSVERSSKERDKPGKGSDDDSQECRDCDTGEKSESSDSSYESDEEDRVEGGEEQRRMFRQRVENNRQYRERMLAPK